MVPHIDEQNVSLAVDCLVFGYDHQTLKLLLIKQVPEAFDGNWGLMGGIVQWNESIDQTSSRILKQFTGLERVYLEQLHVFGGVNRDPVKRTVSVAYFALIDMNEYTEQISPNYRAQWFPVKNLPKLMCNHNEMVELAKVRIRYKAVSEPLLFELLPSRFTMPQVRNLYEVVYNESLDMRIFNRKLQASGLLIKLDDKDSNSKRGDHYYQLHTQNYYMKFQRSLNPVLNPDRMV